MPPPLPTLRSRLLAVLVTAPVAAQGGGFSGQRIVTQATARPSAVLAADLDRDGDLDVLCAASGDGSISWMPNLGNGAFGTRQVLTTAADGANSVFAADVDNDGDVDVLSASGTDNKIAWYQNLGGGVFGPQIVISTIANSPAEVRAADLDGDGRADVLTTSVDGVAWHPGQGNGLFGARRVIATARSQTVHAEDLDGDGDLDVLADLGWHENLGAGTFGARRIISSDQFVSDVHPTDLDGDGDADVLSVRPSFHEVAWFENVGGGSFATRRILSVNTSGDVAGPTSVHSADFDGDGDRDVAVIGSAAWNQLAWFENLGARAFGPPQPIEVGNSILISGGRSVVSADLNGDRADDLLVASAMNNVVAWYESWPTVKTFGAGCGSALLTHSPTSTAALNTTIAANVVHSPTTICVVAMGLSNTQSASLGSLPFDLGTIGMNGCTLLQSASVFPLPTQPSASPFLRIDWIGPMIPNSPQLVGLHIYTQAFSQAPGANALSVLASNAIDWTISS